MTSLGHEGTARLVLALALLLTAAHGCGWLFVRWRQPRVVGEIVGGLLLGPSVLGALAPELQRTVLPDDGPVASVLGGVYELGLVLLMFAAGIELRAVIRRGERRVAGAVLAAGLALPFAAGLAITAAGDVSGLRGPADDDAALALVFAAALAVTSIPVIARIMLDLGLLGTSFARVVLAAAVAEDLVLYAVLAVAVGIAQSGGEPFGLPGELGLDAASAGGAAYYAAATTAVLAVGIAIAALLVRESGPARWVGVNARRSPAVQLVVVLLVTWVCLLLGVVPVFGGLVAGLVLAPALGERPAEAAAPLTGFAFTFFIPLYFALVGLRLDLGAGVDPLFVAALILAACAIKGGSVYLGARLAGEPPGTSRHLAVAMNARGGPGIVLASVAYDAEIIDQGFFAALVILAIVTSMAAGWWLRRAAEGDPALREPVTGRARALSRPGRRSRPEPR
ncbi:MAG TPA: cation:proton antiporter [Thermoleophilaceae bacterium]|jgi:Kef-type K+ transport system membrane component KefB